MRRRWAPCEPSLMEVSRPLAECSLATVGPSGTTELGSVARGDAAHCEDAEIDRAQPDHGRQRIRRDRAAAGGSAADRRLCRLVVVRRAGLPLGVRHHVADPVDHIRCGGTAGRRHRVRGDGHRVPGPARLRPQQRRQRPGGSVSDHGAGAAAAVRFRDSGRGRGTGRDRRAELLGAYPVVPAGRRLRDHRSAVRQRPRLLRLRPAVLPAGRGAVAGDAVPGDRRESEHALHLRRHPVVRPGRCPEPPGAHPGGQPDRHPGAAQGRGLLAGPL